MATEVFDATLVTTKIPKVSAEQKQAARDQVAASLSDMGCTGAEIAEVFAMLGILPHEEGCVCGDC